MQSKTSVHLMTTAVQSSASSHIFSSRSSLSLSSCSESGSLTLKARFMLDILSVRIKLILLPMPYSSISSSNAEAIHSPVCFPVKCLNCRSPCLTSNMHSHSKEGPKSPVGLEVGCNCNTCLSFKRLNDAIFNLTG